MKNRSKQQKSRYLQNLVKDRIIKLFPSLTKKDIDRGLDRYYITGCTAEPCLKGATEIYASKLYEKYLMRKVIVQADEIKKQASDNNQNIYKTIK